MPEPDSDKEPELSPSQAAARAVAETHAKRSMSPVGWVSLLIVFVLLVVLAFR
jgi:hypothetical protein